MIGEESKIDILLGEVRKELGNYQGSPDYIPLGHHGELGEQLKNSRRLSRYDIARFTPLIFSRDTHNGFVYAWLKFAMNYHPETFEMENKDVPLSRFYKVDSPKKTASQGPIILAIEKIKSSIGHRMKLLPRYRNGSDGHRKRAYARERRTSKHGNLGTYSDFVKQKKHGGYLRREIVYKGDLGENISQELLPSDTNLVECIRRLSFDEASTKYLKELGYESILHGLSNRKYFEALFWLVRNDEHFNTSIEGATMKVKLKEFQEEQDAPLKRLLKILQPPQEKQDTRHSDRDLLASNILEAGQAADLDSKVLWAFR